MYAVVPRGVRRRGRVLYPHAFAVGGAGDAACGAGTSFLSNSYIYDHRPRELVGVAVLRDLAHRADQRHPAVPLTKSIKPITITAFPAKPPIPIILASPPLAPALPRHPARPDHP